MTNKIDTGIAKGLHENQFADLTPACRERLLTIMARISESSFRRGLQHGIYFTEKGVRLRTDPWTFRYKATLDKSPPIDGKKGGWLPTALQRLNIEHGMTLLELGFTEVLDHD
jgi:hypothetical protein